MAKKQNDIEAIYNAVLQKGSEVERSAYLDVVCGDNHALRDRVETLLKAHEQAGDFLEVPAVAPNATLDRPPSIEGPGTRIGRYELLELIGEGGMGLVYLAEQKEPVRRQVALKIIKPGMDSKQVIARFEAERQTLAVLDHPNIAHVFDAGTTKPGRPYFVMEYVEGVSITKYCDEQKLNIEERLELFKQVCEGVHHAHQKGIIHRDIKPSNILVSNNGDKAVPKIIDFGIAKAITQPLTEKTSYTEQGQLLGTPEYMSPEQAEMTYQDVDTRSDIYSLGVVLYELLAGVPPFDAKRFREGGIDHIQHIICEEQPRTPSALLTSLGDKAKAVADSRRTQIVTLTRRLHRELEWIPMKAMRKDRTRRYRSASELADDIQNYLTGTPLIAGPESTIYRARKFVRKHAGSVATAALVAAVIVLGLIVSTAMCFRAEQARVRAENAETVAQKQRTLADDRAKDLQRTLYVNSIQLAEAKYREGNARIVRELLDSCPNELRGWEWDRLKHLSDQAQMTFGGHERAVMSVTFSPDGKRIVSGGKQTVRLWDASTGAELVTLGGHQNWVLDVAFSPDGKQLVSMIRGGIAKTWDLESEYETINPDPTLKTRIDEIWSYKYPYIKSAALSPDGKYIAASCLDSTVKVWDTASGGELATLRGHDKCATAVAFSSDSSRVVSADGTSIKIWTVAGGAELMTLRGHESGVLAVAFSSDAKQIAAACWDGTAKVWDTSSGVEPVALEHKELVTTVAFSPDGKRLASGSSDTNIKVWDVESGAELTVLRGHETGVRSVAFSPDGKRIVSVADRTVKVWDPTIDHECMTLQLCDYEVDSIAFSPDGRRILSSSKNDGIKVWDASTRAELMKLRGHEGGGSAMFGPDGKRIISTDGNDIKVWDATASEELMTLSGHGGSIWSMSYCPDGTRIASGSEDKTIRIWDAATGTEVMTLDGHTDVVSGVTFSSDGQRIVSGSWDGSIKIWDSSNGNEVMTFHGHHGKIRAAALSPNGKYIAAGDGSTPAIKIWDATSGVEVKTLRGHRRMVTALTFSHNGKRIVSGSAFGTVKVWDIATGAEVMTLWHHERGYVGCIQFSPDGQTIATAGGGSTVKLWESGPRAAVGGSDQSGESKQKVVD